MTVAMETIRSLRAVTPQNTIIEAQHVGQRFTADNGTELTVFDNISAWTASNRRIRRNCPAA